MSEPTPIAVRSPSAQPGAAAKACGCGDACCVPAAVVPEGGGAQGEAWRRPVAWARRLAWASLAWMSVEGGIGLAAGLRAGSVSLVGWALGSVIEGLASLIVIWRFTGSRTLSETAEGRARKAVAVSFFLLAPYLAVQAIRELVTGHAAEATTLGVVVTALSLVVMPLLGVAKQRLGARLASQATSGEGTQNLMCAAQAAAVLLGLAATTIAGWTWIDPAIALLLAGWAVYEGVESWRGEDCC